jgi:hypothetical protein
MIKEAVDIVGSSLEAAEDTADTGLSVMAVIANEINRCTLKNDHLKKVIYAGYVGSLSAMHITNTLAFNLIGYPALTDTEPMEFLPVSASGTIGLSEFELPEL